MKFDRQLRLATETLWVVTHVVVKQFQDGGRPPYLSDKSSDFHEILHTAADFELEERHVIINKKSCIGQTPSSTERISCFLSASLYFSKRGAY